MVSPTIAMTLVVSFLFSPIGSANLGMNVKPFVLAMPGESQGGREASSRFWGRRGTQRLQLNRLHHMVGSGLYKQEAKRIMLE